MLSFMYVQAAMGVIAHLSNWIGVHDPGRTELLTWSEVTSNIDHLANDEKNLDAIDMLIYDYFRDQPEKAKRVVECESGRDPKAFNAAGPYVGLFQIENGTTNARGNVEHARAMYEARGWQPWPNCGRQ